MRVCREGVVRDLAIKIVFDASMTVLQNFKQETVIQFLLTWVKADSKDLCSFLSPALESYNDQLAMFEFMKHVELIKKSAFKDKITKQKLITILNIIDNAQSNEGLIIDCMELILVLKDEVFNNPNSALMELQQCPELIIRPYTELAIVNNSPALFNKEDPLDVRLGADSHSYSCSVKRLSDVLNAMKCETLSDIWVMQECGKIYVTCEYYTAEFPASSLFIIDLDCHVGRWELSLIRLENCRVIFDKDKHNYLFNSIQKSGLVHIYGSGIDKDKFSIVDNPRIEGVFERQKYNGELSVF